MNNFHENEYSREKAARWPMTQKENLFIYVRGKLNENEFSKIPRYI